MRRTKKIHIERIPTFAFVVDGETEVWYLNMLKRNEKKLRVKIKPEIPNKKSVEEQYNLVRDLANKEYEKVFWIIDLDTVAKEAKEAGKGKKSPFRTFAEYREKLITNFCHVVVIVNNPCLEFWFLLHFERTTKYYTAYAELEIQLKKYILNFEKTQRFFTNEKEDIYIKLKPMLKQAYTNARALDSFSSENPQRAMCEMDLLFQLKELNVLFD